MKWLAILNRHAAELCALGARRVGIFGSVARDEVLKRAFARSLEVMGEPATLRMIIQEEHDSASES